MADTLEFWHPQFNERLALDYFDWGRVVPGSSADRPFRLKNVSSTYTASDITVSVQEMNTGGGSVSVAKQHYLSSDERFFSATVTVSGLAPQAVSDRLILRRVTSLDADPGEHDFQLLAHAATWL